MAFSFPTSPTLNQTYSYGNNVWFYDGSGWQLKQDHSVTYLNVVDNLGFHPFGQDGGVIDGPVTILDDLNFGTRAGIVANNSLGTSGQVLTSNGTSLYWQSFSGGATLTSNNTDAATYYIPMSTTTTGTWTNAVVSDAEMYFVPSTGTLSATIFNSLSDENKKKDIKVITNSLDKISKLRGVSFKWKSNDLPSCGVIAQELKEVLPELVASDMTVNYNGIIALLIECIKELKEKLENGR